MPVDLWSFTLDFYTRPGVEQACLQLQARGADVCVLLCGVWLGWRAVPCHDARVAVIVQAAGPWQAQVVEPLRALRIQWRQAALHDNDLAGLREQLKALELQAERRLLERLQHLSADWPAAQVQDVAGWLAALAGQQDRAARQVLCDAAGALTA